MLSLLKPNSLGCELLAKWAAGLPPREPRTFSIVAKTIGAVPLLAQSFKKIEGIQDAYLYGSFARNQQDAASDIDVLVIGKQKSDALAEAVQKLERQLGREINYTVLSRNELESRRARKDAFLENVWHNRRISLVGAA